MPDENRKMQTDEDPKPQSRDFAEFGDDAETVRDLCRNPEDVYRLLKVKREANAEAKEYREKLEEVKLASREAGELREELEDVRREIHRRELRNRFEIEALKGGIRPDRLSAAAKLAELDPNSESEMEEMVSGALENLKDGFPELFRREGDLPEVDNAGFSRSRGDAYESARAKGDALGMLKALRKK